MQAFLREANALLAMLSGAFTPGAAGTA